MALKRQQCTSRAGLEPDRNTQGQAPQAAECVQNLREHGGYTTAWTTRVGLHVHLNLAVHLFHGAVTELPSASSLQTSTPVWVCPHLASTREPSPGAVPAPPADPTSDKATLQHRHMPAWQLTMRDASSSSSRLACCTPWGSPSMRMRLLLSLSGGMRTDTLYWSLILFT